LLVWVIITMSVIGGLAFRARAPVILIAFGLFGAIGGLVVVRWGATTLRLFVLVYCSSAIAAVMLYRVYMNRYGVPYYIGGSDDWAYEMWAKDVVKSLGIFDYASIRGGVVKQSHNSVGYVYLVSLLYRFGELLGGFHTMLPRLFNAMCLGLLAVFAFRLSKRCGLAKGLPIRVALLVGLMPIMMYIAAHTYRDIFASLLSLVVVYLWAPEHERPVRTTRIWRWSVTLLLVVALSQLRQFQAIAVLTVAFVEDVVSSWRTRRARQWLYGAIVIIAGIAILLMFREKVTVLADWLVEAQERYTEHRIDLSDGLGAYAFSVPLPLGYVLRAGYALISPLPWLNPNVERLWLSVGTTIQYLFLPFLGLGIIHAIRDGTKRHLLLAFSLLFGGVAFVSFTLRHIAQFLPYGAILAAIGFERHRGCRVPIWFWMCWLGLGLVIIYIVIKF
jgi:hypothetical protein